MEEAKKYVDWNKSRREVWIKKTMRYGESNGLKARNTPILSIIFNRGPRTFAKAFYYYYKDPINAII